MPCFNCSATDHDGIDDCPLACLLCYKTLEERAEERGPHEPHCQHRCPGFMSKVFDGKVVQMRHEGLMNGECALIPEQLLEFERRLEELREYRDDVIFGNFRGGEIQFPDFFGNYNGELVSLSGFIFVVLAATISNVMSLYVKKLEKQESYEYQPTSLRVRRIPDKDDGHGNMIKRIELKIAIPNVRPNNFRSKWFFILSSNLLFFSALVGFERERFHHCPHSQA